MSAVIDKANLTNKILEAGIPIEGIGRNPDKTLRIDFRPEATSQQKAQAAAIVTAYDQDAEDAAKAITESARQADLAELISTKADAALTANGNAKTAVANALSAWATATNAQKLDMIQVVLQVQQGMLNREEKIIRVLKRLVQ